MSLPESRRASEVENCYTGSGSSSGGFGVSGLGILANLRRDSAEFMASQQQQQTANMLQQSKVRDCAFF